MGKASIYIMNMLFSGFVDVLSRELRPPDNMECAPIHGLRVASYRCGLYSLEIWQPSTNDINVTSTYGMWYDLDSVYLDYRHWLTWCVLKSEDNYDLPTHWMGVSSGFGLVVFFIFCMGVVFNCDLGVSELWYVCVL